MVRAQSVEDPTEEIYNYLWFFALSSTRYFVVLEPQIF
jgi:hypothetical protein